MRNLNVIRIQATDAVSEKISFSKLHSVKSMSMSMSNGTIILNKWKIFMKYLAKFYLNINDPLAVLPGNDQDLDHENIVNTYLFYQVCKVNDIVYFRDKYFNAE